MKTFIATVSVLALAVAMYILSIHRPSNGVEHQGTDSQPPPQSRQGVEAPPLPPANTSTKRTKSERQRLILEEGRRRSSEKTERMRDAGVLAKPHAPNYPLIGQDGKISRQAIIENGLSTQTTAKLQSAIDRHWETMSQSLLERAVLDVAGSTPEDGIYAYSIQALPDGGIDRIRALEQDIKEIAGDGSGDDLLNAFDPNSYVGGFGKYDIHMKIQRTDHGLLVSDFQFIHPKTGIVARKGSLTEDYSFQYFGYLLKKIHLPPPP